MENMDGEDQNAITKIEDCYNNSNTDMISLQELSCTRALG